MYTSRSRFSRTCNIHVAYTHPNTHVRTLVKHHHRCPWFLTWCDGYITPRSSTRVNARTDCEIRTTDKGHATRRNYLTQLTSSVSCLSLSLSLHYRPVILLLLFLRLTLLTTVLPLPNSNSTPSLNSFPVSLVLTHVYCTYLPNNVHHFAIAVAVAVTARLYAQRKTRAYIHIHTYSQRVSARVRTTIHMHICTYIHARNDETQPDARENRQQGNDRASDGNRERCFPAILPNPRWFTVRSLWPIYDASG